MVGSSLHSDNFPVQTAAFTLRAKASFLIASLWRPLLLLLLVALRVFCLSSDAYARLSWSSALLTDEGFYIHNARNLVLFGTTRTDDFNNALIMPLLHVVQVGVFKLVGVGAIQARSISVALSLLTLWVFFAGLRRAFGERVAWLGLVLLGLDPVFVLYNRMALMDTPACLPLCGAFYAWVRAGEDQAEEGERERGDKTPFALTGQLAAGLANRLFMSRLRRTDSRHDKHFWLALCGACLGLAYCVRGLAAVVVPIPLLLLCLQSLGVGSGKRSAVVVQSRLERARALVSVNSFRLPLAYLAGLVAVLAAYLILWYIPHRLELAHVNRFYLHEQLMPRDFKQLWGNLRAAVTHPHRGVFPYLMKHSPLLLLICGGVAVSRLLLLKPGNSSAKIFSMTQEMRSGLALEHAPQAHVNYLGGWLAVFLLFVSTVDYAPSRYYVLFYPPLAGLCALVLDDLMERGRQRNAFAPRRLLVLCAALWVALNAYWYADWIGHLSYRQRDADAWLAAHLPANSVLFGAVAPGLCLNNRFRCVSTIQNLCNFTNPIERYAPAPRFIVILDRDADAERRAQTAAGRAWADRWKEPWWVQHYPVYVRPERRLHAFPHLIRRYFTIGVYPVPTLEDYDDITIDGEYRWLTQVGR